MKRIILTGFILSFILIGHARTAENQKITQEDNEPVQLTVSELEPETTTLFVAPSTTEKESEKLPLDPIITQTINFSNIIGDWFENLFDKKQNMSFNAHVNKLEKIINAMQAAIVTPLVPVKDCDPATLAAYNLTSTLYMRAKKTYGALNDNKDNATFFKVSNALKKIDKKFSSDQERAKLKKAFKDLTKLTKSDAKLCKKVTTLELVVAENSARTKQKGWWTLAWGLRHRLQCE